MKPKVHLTASDQITIIIDPSSPDVYETEKEIDDAMSIKEFAEHITDCCDVQRELDPLRFAHIVARLCEQLKEMNNPALREPMFDALSHLEVATLETDSEWTANNTGVRCTGIVGPSGPMCDVCSRWVENGADINMSCYGRGEFNRFGGCE